MILGFINKIWDLTNSYLIYETDKKGKNNVVFRFNTIEECLYSSTSQVVSFPTENGTMPVDYKFQEMDTIKVRGVLTKASGLGKLVSGLISDTSTQDSLLTNLKYYKSGVYALNIQTKSGLYENYTLQDFEIPEDYDNYGILEVYMTFRQIDKIGSQKNVNKADANTVPAGIVRLLGLS